MMNKHKYNPKIHHRRSIRLKGYDYSNAGLYFITICCQNRIHRFGTVVKGKMILNEYGQVAHDEWLKLPERFTNFELDVFQIMPDHMHGIVKLTPVGATLAVAQNVHKDKDRKDLDFPADSISPGSLNGDDDLNFQFVQNPFDFACDYLDPDLTLHNMHNDIWELNSPDDNVQQMIHTTNNDNGQYNLFYFHNELLGQNVDNLRFVSELEFLENIGSEAVDRLEAGASPASTGVTLFDVVGAYKSLVANACLSIYKSKNQTMGKLWQRNYYEHIIRNERAYQNISNYIIDNPAKWTVNKFHKQ